MHAVRHVSLLSVPVRTHVTHFHRKASLTSAISNGVRKTANALKTAEARRRQQPQDDSTAQTGQHDRKLVGRTTAYQTRDPNQQERQLVRRTTGYQTRDRGRDQHLAFLRNGSEPAEEDGRHAPKTNTNFSPLSKKPSAPVSIPYTTAGSEFVYGTHSVLAALKAGRRKFYKLYIYVAENELISADDVETPEIVRLANLKKVTMERVDGDWLRLLDKMSDRRPHNGIVLEASPLPLLRAMNLLPVVDKDKLVSITLDVMSQEEKQVANITDNVSTIEVQPSNIEKGVDRAGKNRFPLFLWLDRITDTGNFGAILRTAHYFDVDGIIVPNHGTAPLSAVAVKASAGAAELVPVLVVKDEKAFIHQTKANGWKLLAAVSPHSTHKKHGKKRVSDQKLAAATVQHGPCILAVGNEAEGLRAWMISEADHHLTVKGAQPKGDVVDSLNVSVAAALLIDRVLSANQQPAADD